MAMKVSVIFVWTSLEKFSGHAYSSSTISFSSQIISNSLPFEHVVLDGNEKLWTKTFYNQTFITIGMT